MINQNKIIDLGERIAREFHPERIILFGSYAYGRAAAGLRRRSSGGAAV